MLFVNLFNALIRLKKRIENIIDPKIVCPCCFKRDSWRNCLFRSSNPTLYPDVAYTKYKEGNASAAVNSQTPSAVDNDMSGYKGVGGGLINQNAGNTLMMKKVLDPKDFASKDKITGKWFSVAGIKEDGIVTREKICTKCHHFLPEDGGKIISIIGPRSAGKTVFFIKLINYIEKNSDKLDMDVSFYALDDYSRPCFTIMKKQLLNEEITPDDMENAGRLGITITKPKDGGIETTPPKYIRPILIRLEKRSNRKGITLCLYDFPGEKGNDPVYQNNLAIHMKYADAFFIVTDPFSLIPNINSVLPDGFSEAIQLKNTIDSSFIEQFYTNSMRSAEGILENVATAVLNGKTYTDESKQIKRPAAFIFTKCDQFPYALVKLAEAECEKPIISPDDKALFSCSEPKDYIDLDKVNVNSKKIKKFVKKYNEAFEHAVNSRYDNYKYFMVSSTGANLLHGMQQAIANEINIEKPLMWILSQFDIVEGRQGDNSSEKR